MVKLLPLTCIAPILLAKELMTETFERIAVLAARNMAPVKPWTEELTIDTLLKLMAALLQLMAPPLVPEWPLVNLVWEGFQSCRQFRVRAKEADVCGSNAAHMSDSS
eukprot:5460510-Prymnesium_polylepis.2